MDNLQGSIDGQPISIRPDGYVRFGRDDLLNVLFYDKVVPDPDQVARTRAPMVESSGLYTHSASRREGLHRPACNGSG